MAGLLQGGSQDHWGLYSGKGAWAGSQDPEIQRLSLLCLQDRGSRCTEDPFDSTLTPS